MLSGPRYRPLLISETTTTACTGIPGAIHLNSLLQNRSQLLKVGVTKESKRLLKLHPRVSTQTRTVSASNPRRAQRPYLPVQRHNAVTERTASVSIAGGRVLTMVALLGGFTEVWTTREAN